MGVSKRRSPRATALKALFLLVVVAAIGAVLYPIYPCLDCAVRKGMSGGQDAHNKNCGYCYGKGRATVFDHWTANRDPGLVHPADLRISPK